MYKDQEKRRKNWLEYYYRNKDAQKAANKRINERNRQHIRDVKEGRPCADCGQSFHFYIMDFDHLDDKKDNIATMAGNGYSIQKLDEEIAKCELVCANCHRLRTYFRYKNMAGE